MPENQMQINFDVQAALTRIETKIDAHILNQGKSNERIASLETQMTDLKDDLRDEKIMSWVKAIGAAAAGIGSHFGLHKLGF